MQMQANNGFFGKFGGQFVAETLIPVLDDLDRAFHKYKNDASFMDEFDHYLNTYAGRPTPVYYCKKLSEKYGVDIYLKREDLLHTGAHKINNVIGQALLAKYMGKTRVIAETGAGQHGVATATACALFGLKCVVYMGSVDVERQMPNVKKMKLLGATVIPVEEGLRTLKDAISAALKDWVANFANTHYCFGTVAGPHPFPELVAFFHRVTGQEAHDFFKGLGFMPDRVVACVGGGSNSMGIFQGFLDEARTELIGVEPAGLGLEPGKNAATLALGKLGIFQGSLSYVLQNSYGNIEDVHSVSAGLDYPGVSPQHAFLKESGRVTYTYASDEEALRAFRELTMTEGIIPALESSHALAYVLEHAHEMKGRQVLVNLSGRGDKDFGIIEKYDLEAL